MVKSDWMDCWLNTPCGCYDDEDLIPNRDTDWLLGEFCKEALEGDDTEYEEPLLKNQKHGIDKGDEDSEIINDNEGKEVKVSALPGQPIHKKVDHKKEIAIERNGERDKNPSKRKIEKAADCDNDPHLKKQEIARRQQVRRKLEAELEATTKKLNEDDENPIQKKKKESKRKRGDDNGGGGRVQKKQKKKKWWSHPAKKKLQRIWKMETR